MLRAPVPAETPALVALAASTGLFQPDEAEALLGGVLESLHRGGLGAGHAVTVWADDLGAAPSGWVYHAPDAHSEGVWNLWWIGVAPAVHGRGLGTALLRHVESEVRSAAGRLLVIETSARPPLSRTRAFYRARGYEDCGRIPEFYAPGDAKVIFAKRLARSSE